MLLGGILAASAVAAVAICAAAGTFAGLWWLLWLPVSFLGCFLALVGLAFLFLWVMCAIVRLDEPQEHDSKFYRCITGLYIEAIMMAARVRLRTRGMEQVPQTGRFLLVCNHTSNVDPALLLHAFKKSQLAFISKRENSTMFLVGKLMHRIMCQLVNRENDREALKTILKCIQLIKEDEVSIAVFPEGYINEDRKLHHFRNGVFKIAMKAQVPIVVCTMKNSSKVLHNAMRLKPSEVQLHLLKVIAPEEYAGMTTVEVGELAYRLMADDLGPDLVAAE